MEFSLIAVEEARMTLHDRICRLLPLLWCISMPALAAELNESDYFSDLPEVLTVTRLAQPLSETPGAVTIIDSDKIRRSGARDVTDVLRLVPGYLIGGINGSHSSAAYHVPLDDNGVRNLVLIDGRSAYNSFYLGDTSRGLMGVLLEDIDRIEVLRGSNSAAYGANAMFGVINIITRHSLDTLGGEVAITQGGKGIRDGMARIGWGNEVASFRLSAGRHEDNGWGSVTTQPIKGKVGFGGVFDDNGKDQLHFRGDFRPTTDQEIVLTAGSIDLSQGSGQGWEDVFRATTWRENYLNFKWHKQLSGTDQIRLMATYDEATYHEAALIPTSFPLDPTFKIDFGGESRKTTLEFQHQIGLTSQLRAIWGGGYEHNEAKSPALFYRRDWVVLHEERLFGNLEWRPHEQWLINLGGYWSHHNWVGSNFTPRLMANFHVTPDHTLRVGISDAIRTPNITELVADVRYYLNTLKGSGFREYLSTFNSSGSAKPEKLKTWEVGYLGNLRDWRMTIDLRGYVEELRGLINTVDGTNPKNPVLPATSSNLIQDFANTPGFTIRGFEYQVRWKPLEDTEIWLNQNFQKLVWDNNAEDKDVNLPPTHATTVALFQKLPGGLDFSLMLHAMADMSWGNANDALPPRRRIDARLAWPFRVGTTKAEFALIAQAANGNYPEYLYPKRGYEFERRTFGTLRLEF